MAKRNTSSVSSRPATPGRDFFAFQRDVWERAILFWDTLRQRADNMLAHERASHDPRPLDRHRRWSGIDRAHCLVFWLKRSTGFRATETGGGYQEAMILVKGGYTPDTIIVRSGRPVRLNFRREETASCSDKVILADFQKSAELPAGRTVAVELKEPGEFEFACPMGMFRGRLIVE